MSHRSTIWLIGILASGVALLGRVSGLYSDLTVRFFGSFEGHSIIPLWLEVVCVILFAFGTAIVGLQVTQTKYRIGLFLAILLQPVSAVAVGHLAGCWVAPFAWLTAILVALLGVVGHRFTSVGKRERLLREVFGKNVSEASLAKLVMLPDAVSAKTSVATILSARYLGENWGEAEQLAAQLREEFAWVELQTGHRLLAVWDMPVSLPTAAESAVAASFKLGENWQAGIASGEIAGGLVSETRQWQMRGGAFEKADALCQANATFGSPILLDLATTDLVRDAIVVRPVDFVVLPATSIGVEVFQPLSRIATASHDVIAARDSFWEAVIYFRQKRFPEALAAFQKSGSDAVVDYYLKRLEKLTSSC